MLMFMKKMRKNKKGFTLTELIVVVAILGVLAAVATPIVTTQLATARTNADLATAKTLENAVQMAISDGTIAINADGTITTGAADARTAIAAKVKGGAIPEPSNTDNDFYLTLASGQVTVNTGITGESTGTTIINLNP